MSSRAPNLPSNVFSVERLPGTVPFAHGRIALRLRGVEALPSQPPVSRRRTALADMHPSVHCSIVGTCLSAAELRRLMIKLGVPDAASADDHTLHKQAVALAARPQDGGKLIQKALDRRHEAAIRQCTKLGTESALTQHWQDALARGDIPGAYWAILSHPAATDAVMRRTFGDVHMLSHMVGAANRADIRRLHRLEEENAELAARLESQQRHLRDGFAARDAKIRLLGEALSRALAQAPVSPALAGDDSAAARDALADIGGRLDREIAKRERLEARAERLAAALTEADRGREAAESNNRQLREELALVEAQIGNWWAGNSGVCDPGQVVAQLPEGEAAAPAMPELGGAPALYVGGRPHQVPQLKAMVERAGGVFLYHDGGIEHAPAMLPGLVSRAGCAAVPVDCVSHHAMGIVKRLCRQAGKPFLPLRTSSLASLVAGLATLNCAPDGAAAHGAAH
jgi:hypothetical protein